MLNRVVLLLASSLALTFITAPAVQAADKTPAGKTEAKSPAPVKKPDTKRPEKKPAPAGKEAAKPDPEKAEKVVRERKPAAAGECCRTCRAGKACGDSCISKDRECAEPAGCACDARE